MGDKGMMGEGVKAVVGAAVHIKGLELRRKAAGTLEGLALTLRSQGA